MLGLEIREIYLTLFTAVLGGIGFLIRKIFTSERKIELLEQTLSQLTVGRDKHDNELNDQLSEMRHDIKSLLASRPYPRPQREENRDS